MPNARIVGTGSFLPEKIYTNKDMESLCDTTEDWIEQRTGIKQRHIANEGEGLSDLILPAAKAALEAAGIEPEQLDMVTVSTISADHFFPSTASIVQDALGASKAGAMDLNAACSGFMYGLSTANAFIRTGQAKTCLVCAGELISNRVDWSNRDTGVLFGDGAGAVVVTAHEGEEGILSSYLRSDGSGKEMLWLPVGGSKTPLTEEHWLPGGRMTVHMKGRDLFKRAIIEFGDAIKRAVIDSGVAPEDISLFVPHQANARIITAVAERLGIPEDRIVINIDRQANTVAGTIPIALDEAVRDGRLKPGDIVLMAGFGAGLTWGSLMVRW